MVKFIQSNYSRSLWIFRIALAVFASLASFLTVEAYVFMCSEIYALLPVLIPKNALIYILYGVIYAVLAELFARLLVLLGLRFCRIYTIPKNELAVWAVAALAVKTALTAAFNALYFISPVIVSFGAMPFAFAVNVFVFIGLWAVIKKLYLNDKSAPYAFRALAAVFAIVTAITLFGGGIL